MHTRGLFVVGTDTGVGKTTVAACIVRALRERQVTVGAYKPVVSGAEPGPVWRDVEILSAACDDLFPGERICPQRFQAPLAPPVAARLEGSQVNAALLREGAVWWQGRVDALIIEGAGGLLTPLTDSETVADLACDLGYPLLVVARAGLGTLNHTLLTLEAARHRNLSVAGIVLNASTPPEAGDPSPATNPAELARRSTVPILMNLPHVAATGLLHAVDFRRIDWLALLK